MRISPKESLNKATAVETERKLQIATRKAAIWFIVLIQIAIIYKMLF